MNRHPFKFQDNSNEPLQAPPTFPLLNNYRERYLRLNGAMLLNENESADIPTTDRLSDNDHHHSLKVTWFNKCPLGSFYCHEDVKSLKCSHK